LIVSPCRIAKELDIKGIPAPSRISGIKLLPAEAGRFIVAYTLDRINPVFAATSKNKIPAPSGHTKVFA